MDRHKLEQLLKTEEGPKLDFKAKLSMKTDSEKKELAKDVSAIANSRGGRGYIVFGIEDKTKKIIGIDPDDFKEERIQQVIYNRVDPPVPISLDILNLGDKSIAVISIYKSTSRPHQIIQNGAFFLRRGSTTDLARRSELASMLQENGLITYETTLIKNSSVEDLDKKLIKKLLKGMSYESENLNFLLTAMGVIGKNEDTEDYNATIGGMLLLGASPQIFLPNIYIKISNAKEQKYLYGNLLSLLEQSVDYLRTLIKDNNFNFEGAEAVIANALIHRDYLDISRGIAITITDKNVEISNPGSYISGNSVYKLMTENNTSKRNPWLYQRMMTLDEKQRFIKTGFGLLGIREAFAHIGEVKLLNIGSKNLFKVILPRKIKEN